MARAIWSGSINFGLVSIPVAMYSATEDHTVHFHQFQRGTADRIRYQRINERTGKEVDYADIVKGAEVGGGDYVIVEPEELDAIAPGRSRTIDITRFVDLDEIDPVYFQKTYWLAPAGRNTPGPTPCCGKPWRGPTAPASPPWSCAGRNILQRSVLTTVW
jgi:DNA end-binding protein Ku